MTKRLIAYGFIYMIHLNTMNLWITPHVTDLLLNIFGRQAVIDPGSRIIPVTVIGLQVAPLLLFGIIELIIRLRKKSAAPSTSGKKYYHLKQSPGIHDAAEQDAAAILPSVEEKSPMVLPCPAIKTPKSPQKASRGLTIAVIMANGMAAIIVMILLLQLLPHINTAFIGYPTRIEVFETDKKRPQEKQAINEEEQMYNELKARYPELTAIKMGTYHFQDFPIKETEVRLELKPLYLALDANRDLSSKDLLKLVWQSIPIDERPYTGNYFYLHGNELVSLDSLELFNAKYQSVMDFMEDPEVMYWFQNKPKVIFKHIGHSSVFALAALSLLLLANVYLLIKVKKT